MPEDLLQQSNVPVLTVVPVPESLTHGMSTDRFIDPAGGSSGIEYIICLGSRERAVDAFLGRNDIIILIKLQILNIFSKLFSEVPVYRESVFLVGLLVPENQMIFSGDVPGFDFNYVGNSESDISSQELHHIIFIIPVFKIFFNFFDLILMSIPATMTPQSG